MTAPTAVTVHADKIRALSAALVELCDQNEQVDGGTTTILVSSVEYALARFGIQPPTWRTTERDDPAPAGYVPPTVTVSSLFERAATLVDQHQFADAAAILAAVTDATPSPLLSAYVALAAAMAEVDRGPGAGTGVAKSMRAAETDLRGQVFDLLVRGPDAPAPTGKETF
jgi:hypothetical protein